MQDNGAVNSPSLFDSTWESPMRRERGPQTTSLRAAGDRIFTERQWCAIAESLRLSEREFQIVRCCFDDLKESAIARHLGISYHTVHTHLERLYKKLGVCSRPAMMVQVFSAYIALN